MRLEPVQKWIVARVALTKAPGAIVMPDASGKGNTRCYLIEAVSPEAAAAGYKPGDLVVARAVYDLFFYAKSYHRVQFLLEEITSRVHDVSLGDLVGLDGKPLEEKREAA